ncbi:uncharacterized protein B0I36DRAFT_391042 [Microdochium trichocladiopsis]|uniref:Uncharacterized protein n=1 Tax=Microdochium trichocladiopsis TaxID=1682393 RepID=A0A9P9BW34_9PEZI|nr:uncharacterized protein B0I36DRAFT_391042 [Microdochium trichocladiopsis]KAH7040200.1 hypothetical protein B0I36DRAFT_391042 [Microdochium trichocladiopsis]
MEATLNGQKWLATFQNVWQESLVGPIVAWPNKTTRQGLPPPLPLFVLALSFRSGLAAALGKAQQSLSCLGSEEEKKDPDRHDARHSFICGHPDDIVRPASCFDGLMLRFSGPSLDDAIESRAFGTRRHTSRPSRAARILVSPSAASASARASPASAAYGSGACAAGRNGITPPGSGGGLGSQTSGQLPNLRVWEDFASYCVAYA